VNTTKSQRNGLTSTLTREKNMNIELRDAVIRVIVTVILGVGVCFGWIALDRHYDREEAEKAQEKAACEAKGDVWEWNGCETEYDRYTRCLGQIRMTFHDLTDTVGVSQNNQDSISKTMAAEVDRCMEMKRKSN